MKDNFFLDTDILVYSFDRSQPQKQSISKKLINEALTQKTGNISYQVIQEFLNIASRKFATPLSLEDCETYLSNVLEPLCSVFSSPELFQIRSTVRRLHQDGHKLQVTSENCIEFWNVATRPVEKNGFGLTPTETEQLLRIIEQLFPVLDDNSEIYQEWRRLVVIFGVSGVQVHDARLVASMKINAISHILTFNAEDFKRYISEEIVAVTPGIIE